MNRCFLFLFFFVSVVNKAHATDILSPDEFLGYRQGEKFTPHHRVLDYFRYISSVSKNVKLQEYGKTYEGRPLVLCFIGAEENIGRLEDIRKNNLRLAGIEPGVGSVDAPSIVWFSYNVHGNEASSTEAALQTLHALVGTYDRQIKERLKNLIVVIDPCLNPDGRERYVNFYNSTAGLQPDAYPFSREHMEPWPGGRTNHYYFDLNRDWAWQTQLETQQRMAVFNSWLPQIHVDFHEQGINEPYYFAPAAEPYHETITPWQREFQKIVGKNNARHFDEKNWMYFTRESFDLLYPSYGDTYPIYNGSIGMTYEQAGSHRAGLAVITGSGDTLTLKDRIEHHCTAALSTLETASSYSKKLNVEFKNYFTSSKKNPPGDYKSYVVKAENRDRLKALELLLKRNGISYGFGASGSETGFNYFTGKSERFSINNNDLIIDAFQSKSVLLKVLFEPKTIVTDSNTYDITAWSLPYAYGLKTYAVKKAVQSAASGETGGIGIDSLQNAVAYIGEWNSSAGPQFLSTLLRFNLRVRFSEGAIEAGGRKFSPGSLIISRSSNSVYGSGFDRIIQQLAKEAGVRLTGISSGFMEKGADLGSSQIKYLRKPRVAVLSGEEVSPLSLGEILHFFEQDINYPISVIRFTDFNKIDLSDFNVFIFPDGLYGEMNAEKLQDWVSKGGKLIAMGDAVVHFADKKLFGIKAKDIEADSAMRTANRYEKLKAYANRDRDYIETNIPGAIYKVDLDSSHPLGFGYPGFYFSLKTNDHIYQFLEKGWNVGVIKKNNYVSGVAGRKVKEKLQDGLLFGVEEVERGCVVYFADNPIFRGFWENGKLMFANAIFMVGQ